MEQSAGQHFTTFDLDKYGLRTTWEWTETTQTAVYMPSYGGSWIGGQYVPYYGGTSQLRTDTNQHKGSLTIPFSDVYFLRINYWKDLNGTSLWWLRVFLDGKDTITLRASNEKTVRQLGDAIATLSKERGRSIKFSRLGLATFL